MARARATLAAPRACLGLTAAGFPNPFTITGPGSPSVLANRIVCIERHVDWTATCIDHLRARGLGRIGPRTGAGDARIAHVAAAAGASLRATCGSWYVGADIPGKPRVFMPCIRGFPACVEQCEAVVANRYEGFEPGRAAAMR